MVDGVAADSVNAIVLPIKPVQHGDGPLNGVTYVLKDNLTTAGIHTTCASPMLAGYVPDYDSAVYERLKAAGAVLIGKANMDEYAFGSLGVHSIFGPTKNPRDTERSAGGSSSGSAAAVAAGLCAFSLGTDTGGSVRLPAAWCGVVGFKPTYGAVSRYGLIAYASSFDTVGIFAHTVELTTRVYNVLIGEDGRDMRTYAAQPVRLDKPPAISRAALVREHLDCLDAPMRSVMDKAAQRLASLGIAVETCSLPLWKEHMDVYVTLAFAQGYSNLSRYDERRYHVPRDGFGPEVMRRISIGGDTLFQREPYFAALTLRDRIIAEYDRLFDRFDVILSPVSDIPPPLLASPAPGPSGAYDAFTVGANLASLPSISLPLGEAHGLPAGVMLTAQRRRDDVVLCLGNALMDRAVP